MKAAKLGIEDVTFSDRISHLPDDLLFRILSLVPISDAMKTSLLSKRWKSLWKMMPMLEYDENSCPNIGSLGFVEFCRRSLQLHEAPVLKTLNLKLMQYSCYSLKFPSFQNNLRVFQKLVVLKLHTIFLGFTDSGRRRNFSGESPICFRSLKSLHLTHVTFKGEKSFCRLISACPVLEDLFLSLRSTDSYVRISHYSRSLFTISVPSLQRLEINDFSMTLCDSRFEIKAPSLKYLKVNVLNGRFKFTEDMPKLVEATVAVLDSQTDKFLRFLTSVEFLSIHLCTSEVLILADIISQRLLHLELCIYGKIQLNLLLHLLKHSPKLQILKLQEVHWRMEPSAFPNRLVNVREFKDQPLSICNPSSVPECLSFHLETLQWRGYKGTEEEKEVAVYILQNARCLKTAAISIYSEGPLGGEKELMMIKELRSMSKASTSCQLVIQLNNFS